MSSNIIRPDLTFSFTRPADVLPYSAGDQVANSVTAGSVTPMKWSIGAGGRGCVIRTSFLWKSSSTVTLADFKLQLFNKPLAAQFGDNVAVTATNADFQGYVGQIILSTASGWANGTFGAVTQGYFNGAIGYQYLAIPACLDGNLYGILTTTAAYTPASAEQFQIRLVVEQD